MNTRGLVLGLLLGLAVLPSPALAKHNKGDKEWKKEQKREAKAWKHAAKHGKRVTYTRYYPTRTRVAYRTRYYGPRYYRTRYRTRRVYWTRRHRRPYYRTYRTGYTRYIYHP